MATKHRRSRKPEVTKQLKRANNKHYIVGRVFHIKVKHIVNVDSTGCGCRSLQVSRVLCGIAEAWTSPVRIILWQEGKIKLGKMIIADIPEHNTDPSLCKMSKPL
ncbi:hypothetical protein J6590_095604 [Homalodisca vitripennis]|nr:hypothetical protein J6590_095604 [Homalodisca vitripennis]